MVSLVAPPQSARALRTKAQTYLRSDTRFIDFAFEVRVIELDPSGDYSIDELPFTYRLLSAHKFGGKLDSITRRFVGPPGSYVVAHVSPKQWELIQGGPHTGVLLQGGEGSGKSETAAIWTAIQIVSRSFPGKRAQAGATAPVLARLNTFRNILLKYIPASWGLWREKKSEWRFKNGLTINFVAAKEHSGQTGSPFQGFTWGPGGFCVSDEVQDYSPHSLDRIETRGRGAVDGRFLRFCTATPKDDSTWRDYLDNVRTGRPHWINKRIIGPENIFVDPLYWERLKQSGMSDREYRRSVLAEDLKPETTLYYGFERKRNIAPRPFTRNQTALITHGYKLLVGHDPGRIQDTSIILRAFQQGSGAPTWYVVGEVITAHQSTRAHVQALLAKLSEFDDIQGAHEVLVKVDPHPTTEYVSPETVIRQFLSAGFIAEKAAHEIIHKKDRVDMLNGLFFSAAQISRLLIEQTSQGLSVAPSLVKSLESQVRDLQGKAESGPKDKTDLSHYTTALAFALWQYEKERWGQSIIIKKMT